MTAAQVYYKIGKNDGKSALDGVLKKIRDERKLKVLTTEDSADNNGKNSHATVLFGYVPSAQEYRSFIDALNDVTEFLKTFNFNLNFRWHENDDGCVLVSYSIV